MSPFAAPPGPAHAHPVHVGRIGTHRALGADRTERVRGEEAPQAPRVVHVPVSPPVVWRGDLPEPSPAGLGPSVAELTLGRPPRAPRPGDGA